MPPIPLGEDSDHIHGWVSSGNTRGTGDILISCLTTIWLCTWTSLCLHIPPEGERYRNHVLHAILYKSRWQLFTLMFPEVLVATAAEQWLSARQSVKAFQRLGHSNWTVRHGFFADMGGIMVAPADTRPFPVDSQQLAYLVENNHLAMPNISVDELRALNKADGLARLFTLGQMAWFCISSAARGAQRLGFCTLEATTLAYILCTLHTFFFWYFKPLDPGTQLVFPMNHVSVSEICKSPRTDVKAETVQPMHPYTVTPLDFIKPQPDPKSLITPFWFGLTVVSPPGLRNRKTSTAQQPAQTLPNSRVLPQDGISTPLMVYMLLFQVAYFGLLTLSNAADFGLIAVYVAAIPVGTYFAPWLGRWLFDMEATHIIQVAKALPTWAKILIHGPFVWLYIAARTIVLVESLISFRALPQSVYVDVDWTSFLPHL